MGAKAIERIDGDGCFQAAQRMARFGRRDWIWWRDATGAHAARNTPTTLKAALLAGGTKGKWTLIAANTGTPHKGFWWLGINILAQMKRGWA